MQRGGAGDRKGGRCDLRDFDWLRCSLSRHQVVKGGAIRAEMLDRRQLSPQRREFVYQLLLFAAGRLHELEFHDAIAAGERQLRVEHAGNRFERRGAHRDGDRHREPGHDRQAGMFEQHAQAESRVEPQRVQPAGAVRAVRCLAESLAAAGADQRAPPGGEAFGDGSRENIVQRAEQRPQQGRRTRAARTEHTAPKRRFHLGAVLDAEPAGIEADADAKQPCGRVDDHVVFQRSTHAPLPLNNRRLRAART